MSKRSRSARRRQASRRRAPAGAAKPAEGAAPPGQEATPDFHEYRYVVSDLKHVIVLAAGIFAVLIALSFVIG